MKAKRGPTLVGIVIIVVVLGILAAIVVPQFTKARTEPKQIPPPEVSVFEVKTEPVPIHREYVGQIFGFEDIAITARIEGYLEGIHFEEGFEVKKDDLLYTLESQTFEADVAAKLSVVAAAQTMLAKAKSDLDRIEPLAEANAVSQSDLDGAVARHEASIAGLEAARANLRAARIQLDYTKIHSPVSGIIGKTKAKIGDFVGRAPNPVILNTVSRIDTVLVEFFITETEYLKVIRRYIDAGKIRDQDRERTKLELILADGSFYEHKGQADFIDREVDPATGSMLVQASFPNPKELLRPGQFARVRARVEVVEDGILIPQRCVMELQGMYNVYVVDKENKVEKRHIEADLKMGSLWLIREGLEAGEKVVYEGLQKVKPGATVNPKLIQIESTEQEEEQAEESKQAENG
ncbi:MAG: efflux RND transporter periplasmic adaptor subunit [Planctomycetota bacterium]|jgi:membrane fusion protein (multidrug efflux system)